MGQDCRKREGFVFLSRNLSIYPGPLKDTERVVLLIKRGVQKIQLAKNYNGTNGTLPEMEYWPQSPRAIDPCFSLVEINAVAPRLYGYDAGAPRG